MKLYRQHILISSSKVFKLSWQNYTENVENSTRITEKVKNKQIQNDTHHASKK